MTHRPPVLDAVELPKLVNPSQLVSLRKCALRAFAAGNARLPPHPLAVLGSALHGALEAAGRRAGEDGLETRALMMEALEVAEQKWRATRTDAVSLRDAIGQTELSRRVANVAGRIRKILSEGSTRSPTGGSPSGDWGPEVWLEDADLGLKGRPDLLLRDEHGVVVTDWKSGRTTATDDELDPDVRLQLDLYGLLVSSRHLEEEVKLRVVGRRIHEWEFDADARRRALDAVRDAERFIGAGVVSAEALANPGEACSRCSVRHRCAAYLELAPTWWERPPEWSLPVDVWGEVRAVTGSDDFLSVDLIRPRAGSARVTNVQVSHFDRSVQVGGWYEGFSLCADDRARTRGGWHRNFKEVGLHPGEWTAWSAACWVAPRPADAGAEPSEDP